MPLFEAEDASLTRWHYRDILFRRPISQMRYPECPNFFQVDHQWLLLLSPYRPIEYWVGDFDPSTLTFTPQVEGILDYSWSEGEEANGFYASNILFDRQGRCVLLGWVRGFPAGRGWNGCLALPRLLTIGPDGRPRQMPLPELSQLRSQSTYLSDLSLSGQRPLEQIQGDTLEIKVEFQPGDATSYGLMVRCAEDGSQGVAILYDGQTLEVAGRRFPFTLTPDETALSLHLFLDKSLLELFVNGGRTAVTRVIAPPVEHVRVALVATEGSCLVKTLEAWSMQAIG